MAVSKEGGSDDDDASAIAAGGSFWERVGTRVNREAVFGRQEQKASGYREISAPGEDVIMVPPIK